MNESLLLRPADVDALAERLAEILWQRIEPELSSKRRLVDRQTMAKSANISVASLDRLVAQKQVPSVLVGTRRLFDPDATLDALAK